MYSNTVFQSHGDLSASTAFDIPEEGRYFCLKLPALSPGLSSSKIPERLIGFNLIFVALVVKTEEQGHA